MCAAESSERWSERQAENMVLVQCDRDNPLVALGKPRDILDILREGSDRKTYPNWHGICKAAADEIERLRAERDEARRKICKIESECICDPPRSPQKYARLMGWDCFKEGKA